MLFYVKHFATFSPKVRHFLYLIQVTGMLHQKRERVDGQMSFHLDLLDATDVLLTNSGRRAETKEDNEICRTLDQLQRSKEKNENFKSSYPKQG